MRLGWRGVVGIALSIVLLAWTLKDVSLADVWRALAASNVLLLGLSAGCALWSPMAVDGHRDDGEQCGSRPGG